MWNFYSCNQETRSNKNFTATVEKRSRNVKRQKLDHMSTQLGEFVAAAWHSEDCLSESHMFVFCRWRDSVPNSPDRLAAEVWRENLLWQTFSCLAAHRQNRHRPWWEINRDTNGTCPLAFSGFQRKHGVWSFKQDRFQMKTSPFMYSAVDSSKSLWARSTTRPST